MKNYLFKYLFINWSIFFFSLVFVCTSCKKFIEVDPPVTSTTNVFSADPTAAGVLTGIYAQMSQSGPNNSATINTSLLLGLSADELTLYSGSGSITHISYYRNSLSPSAALTIDFWKNYYPFIYKANSAIEELKSSNTLTPTIKNHLLGEALFVRAFCYFYLVNLYGDVPLVLTTNYTANEKISRTSKNEVWQQVIADLKDAEELLNSSFLNDNISTPTTERVRPTKWSAAALLAKAYLYNNDWVNAEAAASRVIGNTTSFGLETLDDVFKKNSKEAIWQLQPVNTGWNTEDARVFILTGNPNFNRPVYLSQFLLNSFETNDLRRVNGNWVKSVTVGANTYHYPYKYKVSTLNAPVSEYTMVLRLAEQYLIRAEARAQQGKILEGSLDLNAIRNRAGLISVITNDKNVLLNAIFHERQVELFTEWGQRWLDLKRSGTVDAVMGNVRPVKANGLSWQSFLQLYPIPVTEIQRDPSLIQNPGY